MPFGFERLNERSQRPNALINFIKPLEGPDKAVAEDYLNRIAAQCYPIMKAAHIAVMSLEEYEPNPEFLGRNFNAGESIQLVLKNKQGHWLGFKFVQMVMMHELAHCKQMNHGRDFWKVRNGFAEEMEGLWKKRYSGEGVWGRGKDLATGSFMQNSAVEPGSIPEHLCGGTYRRRGRKRKAGAQGSNNQRLTYAQRQQKRIARKFGKHGDGNELGDDELVRRSLEVGKTHYGKPRVANSKRGRELRAQAALARFAVAKEDNSKQSAEDDTESDVEWSESEDGEVGCSGTDDNFIKVCGEENENDEDASQEMADLNALTASSSQESGDYVKTSSSHQESGNHGKGASSCRKNIDRARAASLRAEPAITIDDAETESEADDNGKVTPTKIETTHIASPTRQSETAGPSIPPDMTQQKVPPDSLTKACPICSLENATDSLLCMACSHVLRPSLVKGSWHCTSEQCRGSTYLNAGDAGRCGICGSLAPKIAPPQSTGGTMTASILRWD